MNIEEIREYCLLKNGVTEDLPFGDNTLVFRVGGKIFLLADLGSGTQFNVKSDPDLAVELRERHEEVIPGFHMNKKHWNTVFLDGRLNRNEVMEMVDHSYELVFKSLPKKIQEELKG